MQLVDEMLADGFITAGDPLQVTLPEHITPVDAWWCSEESLAGKQMRPQSVGYSKGQARMVSALAMMSLCVEDGIDGVQLKQVCALALLFCGTMSPDNNDLEEHDVSVLHVCI